MKKEDKDLLFKYLCMALPYEVIIEYNNDSCVETREMGLGSLHDFMFDNAEIKPYLRSMSSMTEEEKEELLNLLFDKEAKYFYIDEEGLIDGRKFNLFKEGINYPSFCPINIVLYTNWLLENHFDFMNLISKDLAIEVIESNNPYK